MKKSKKLVIATAMSLMLLFSAQAVFAEEESSNFLMDTPPYPYYIAPDAGEEVVEETPEVIEEAPAIIEEVELYIPMEEEVVESATADSLTISLKINDNTAIVNGQEVVLDVPASIINSRTMVPVRFVAENLGAEVAWDNATKTVSIASDDVDIELVIKSTTATVNGAEVELDAPAVIIDGRTMLPARFVAENLGAEVAWDAASKTVTITK